MDATGAATGSDDAMDDATTGPDAPSLCLTSHLLPELGSDPMLVGDVDGDGLSEVWRINGVDDTFVLTSFAVSADGTVTPISEVEVPQYVWKLVDFDGDGHDDALLESIDGEAPTWLAGQDDASFDTASPRPVVLTEGLGLFAELYVDADGLVDGFAAMGEQQVAFARNVGEGTFVAASPFSIEPMQFGAGAYATDQSDVFALYEDNGSIGFGPGWMIETVRVEADGTLVSLGRTPEVNQSPVDARDVDGDGDVDVIAKVDATGLGSELVLWRAGAEFVGETIAEDAPVAATGDFVGDGTVQLLVADSRGAPQLLTWPTPASTALTGMLQAEYVDGTLVVDADDDGRDELLVRTFSRDQIHLYVVEPCA
jgi:hypothetical protein